MTDQIAAVSPLPTVEEILAGDTQGGVPRPTVLSDDADDGSVQRIGSVPVAPMPRALPRISRWSAIKQLLRIIFGGSVTR